MIAGKLLWGENDRWAACPLWLASLTGGRGRENATESRVFLMPEIPVNSVCLQIRTSEVLDPKVSLKKHFSEQTF